MSNRIFHVKVGGGFACFTDPGLKVERCSYPVMTPSAARGMLEAIFWKPEFRWEIREITVLKPIKQISIMRNEIEDRQTDKPIVIEQKRQQRASLILKDVEYIISAVMMLKPGVDNFGKYIDQFERKVERGQCHHTPCLGTREFAAWFETATGEEKPLESINIQLGQMLFDIAYKEDKDRQEISFHRHAANEKKRIAKGYAHALYFEAELKNSVMKVPHEKYRELYDLEGIYV
ncbi:MAG: type I-C CRISPR-associated protein Cas5c [Candidatus Loosdrechtia sp.]|uniref:type I-C CRISPR-associated protein Cas5c n=1 Tax=Candidatus Loosdrechtia sp. TaxID=3101272 RepID=UPI003A689DA0|nr:MAG: type I-C CRISPR-associated protein Cas5c [Candidatus Jettenia sp. AMX2]